MRKILYKIILLLFISMSFASTGAKSHSAELLHVGRYIPLASNDSFLFTAKTFSSLSSRKVDVYNINSVGQLEKYREISSPKPMSGDDFGFSIAASEKHLLIGAPGYNDGHGIAYLYELKDNIWTLVKTYENPVSYQDKGYPHKFGYNVSISDKYLSISSPFNNDGVVYIYDIDSVDDNRISSKLVDKVDVRELGDVEGCYAIGPDQFGFGISTSFKNNKLVIGSLKDFVYLVEYQDGIPFGTEILNPTDDEEMERYKFGQTVYLGSKNLYISSLASDMGKGKVFVYPYLDGLNRTDENPWSNPYEIQPNDLIDNSYFGYSFSELNNEVVISTFNQAVLYKYQINVNDKLEQISVIKNDSLPKNAYFGRNVLHLKNGLMTDAYYNNELFIYNDNSMSFSNSLDTSDEILSIKDRIECTNGFAGQFECDDIDLFSFMDKTEIGGSNSTALNDIWGWTDPQTGKEYALVGMSNGTSFVDISDAENPVYIGRLPTQTSNSSWRDVKVYQNHAFIVSEAGGHGMQVFDLTELRNFNGTSFTFSNSAYYSGFGNAHNIFINEDTGFAYAIGTGTCGPGGLHIVDISNPTNPTKSACISDPSTGRNNTGYVHDVQCVIYNGPDTDYQGKEICFGSNETNVWVVDVSTKSDDNNGSKTIGLGSYDNYYTHQGWLTEDHKYFIQNDELDESNNAYNNTRTLIWDVQDLSNPVVETVYLGPTPSIDHNNYIIGNKVYMSHYTSGLRVLDISDINNPSQDSFFDVYPANNSTSFNGTWSNYPYYDSGMIVVTSIDEGLFVVGPSGTTQGQAPTVSYDVPTEGSVKLKWDLIGNSTSVVNIYQSTEPGFSPSSSTLLDTVNYPNTEYDVSNLDSSIFYYFRLSVTTNNVEGPFSEELRVKAIIAPNQPPTIDPISNVAFNEDTEYVVSLDGVSYGDDVNAQNITISATSSNTDLIDNISITESTSSSGVVFYALGLDPKENMYGNAQISVTVQDDGGTENGGIDTVSETFDIDVYPVNDSPANFATIGEMLVNSENYLQGVDYRTLYVTPENINDSLKFVWEESIDVDGDNVQYKMIGYEQLSFLTMDTYTSDNFLTLAFKDIVAETDTVSVYQGSWSVIATDGQSFNTANSISGKLRIDSRELIPDRLEIKQSYPNPFRDFTTIEFDVPSTQQVVIRIFNIKGQIVRTLVDGEKSAGYYSEVWDGKNDAGDPVSSGVYFCQMYTPKNPNGGQFIKAKKMVKIR